MKQISIRNDVKTMEDAFSWIKKMEEQFKLSVDTVDIYKTTEKFNKATKKYEPQTGFSVCITMKDNNDEEDYV